MNKLYVLGNCFSDNIDSAQELFKVLEDAGYTLAYSVNSKTACTIMKEVAEPEEENEDEQ